MQRYHEYRDGCEPDDDGEWVYWDEATALIAAKDAEIARLRKAIEDYRSEFMNPSPDMTMRRVLRQKLFDALAGGE